ncbi:MAG: hypothetical protein H7Z43_02915, partial [Clostridia bacterium]|nr:hypothetical protein [Deltaproteobacteria bacterium]
MSLATPAYAVGGMAGAFGQKGQFVPFGRLSVGFESQNDNDNVILQIDPGLLYFINEHWAVGGTFSFNASVGDL